MGALRCSAIRETRFFSEGWCGVLTSVSLCSLQKWELGGDELHVEFPLVVNASEAAACIQLQAPCIQPIGTSSCDISDAAARQSTQSTSRVFDNRQGDPCTVGRRETH